MLSKYIEKYIEKHIPKLQKLMALTNAIDNVIVDNEGNTVISFKKDVIIANKGNLAIVSEGTQIIKSSMLFLNPVINKKHFNLEKPSDFIKLKTECEKARKREYLKFLKEQKEKEGCLCNH